MRGQTFEICAGSFEHKDFNLGGYVVSGGGWEWSWEHADGEQLGAVGRLFLDSKEFQQMEKIWRMSILREGGWLLLLVGIGSVDNMETTALALHDGVLPVLEVGIWFGWPHGELLALKVETESIHTLAERVHERYVTSLTGSGGREEEFFFWVSTSYMFCQSKTDGCSLSNTL